jgi:hypothetical protein
VILHPNVLALLISSLLIALMALYAGGYGTQILRNWDLASGSERQLQLERKTYLISTIVSYFLGFQLISLFLFLFTVDGLSTLFIGAMCAVGSLTVNGFGYPTLLLKIGTFVLAGLWLIINHADNQGYDYPLIRIKYALLLVLVPFILAEAVIQTCYFLGLRPDIITSCCGSLFSPNSRTLATEIINAPPLPMLALFFGSTLITLWSGLWFVLRQRGGYLFALLSGLQFPIALIAVISVISLYIYQMPSHHCPFCILQKEYYFIGYPLYVAILTAAVCGLGVGLLQRFHQVPSLLDAVPAFQRKLAATALWALAVLALLSVISIFATSFTLRGQ